MGCGHGFEGTSIWDLYSVHFHVDFRLSLAPFDPYPSGAQSAPKEMQEKMAALKDDPDFKPMFDAMDKGIAPTRNLVYILVRSPS